MELEEIRKKIDWIDIQLVKMLGERLEMALRTRRHKQEMIDKDREKMVLENVKRFSTGLLSRDYVETLFRRIISESHNIGERGLKLVGFQGEHGAYSEMASIQAFPDYAAIPLAGFRDVFEKVEKGSLDLGIVPVENSTEGIVTEVHDLLAERNLFICGEIDFPVHHHLLTLPTTNPHDIHVVYSHPQALAQCRQLIHRRKLEARPFYDTAGAARWLMESRSEGTAVIAGSLCADLYGLEAVLSNIEDETANVTRFLVLCRQPNTDEASMEKSSIVFSTLHEAGALYRVLERFASAAINLTRIESRPVKNDPGRYLFFLDFHGASSEETVRNTLDEVKKCAHFYKFLGSYGKV